MPIKENVATTIKVNEQFGQLADDETINQTKAALELNGITVFIAANGAEAKQQTLALIPVGADVMTMTSMTLEDTGIVATIAESGHYKPTRDQLNALDDETELKRKRELGAAPEWAIGSVHAVTQDGQLLIASNSGSQLPAYAYGAQHVIWVIGAQKIVANLDEGLRRIYEYSFPLENERAQQAYGEGSNVSKILIINKEKQPQRLTAIIVKEKVGF